MANQDLASRATNQDFSFGLFIGTLNRFGLEIQESMLSDEDVSQGIIPFSILDSEKKVLFHITISKISFEIIEKEEKEERKK